MQTFSHHQKHFMAIIKDQTMALNFNPIFHHIDIKIDINITKVTSTIFALILSLAYSVIDLLPFCVHLFSLSP